MSLMFELLLLRLVVGPFDAPEDDDDDSPFCCFVFSDVSTPSFCAHTKWRITFSPDMIGWNTSLNT